MTRAEADQVLEWVGTPNGKAALAYGRKVLDLEVKLACGEIHPADFYREYVLTLEEALGFMLEQRRERAGVSA